MVCTPHCVRPTPAQCHCSACHITFGGIKMFDRHRSEGRCLNPADLPMVYRNGVWRERLSVSQQASLDRLRRQAGIPQIEDDAPRGSKIDAA